MADHTDPTANAPPQSANADTNPASWPPPASSQPTSPATGVGESPASKSSAADSNVTADVLRGLTQNQLFESSDDEADDDVDGEENEVKAEGSSDSGETKTDNDKTLAEELDGTEDGSREARFEEAKQTRESQHLVAGHENAESVSTLAAAEQSAEKPASLEEDSGKVARHKRVAFEDGTSARSNLVRDEGSGPSAEPSSIGFEESGMSEEPAVNTKNERLEGQSTIVEKSPVAALQNQVSASPPTESAQKHSAKTTFPQSKPKQGTLQKPADPPSRGWSFVDTAGRFVSRCFHSVASDWRNVAIAFLVVLVGVLSLYSLSYCVTQETAPASAPARMDQPSILTFAPNAADTSTNGNEEKAELILPTRMFPESPEAGLTSLRYIITLLPQSHISRDLKTKQFELLEAAETAVLEANSRRSRTMGAARSSTTASSKTKGRKTKTTSPTSVASGDSIYPVPPDLVALSSTKYCHVEKEICAARDLYISGADAAEEMEDLDVGREQWVREWNAIVRGVVAGLIARNRE